jgi:uncharacterized protein with PIN domain
MSEEPTFIVDSMLGTLAKWLRILGFDSLYFRTIDDNELIKISKQQGRILLTKDNRLVKSKKIDRYILVCSDKLFDQLKEVLSFLSKYGYFSFNPYSRCIRCNGKLIEVDKKMVFNEIPEYIYRKYESFFKCSNCGNVYWEGTHKDMIDRMIKEILKGSFPQG